VSFLKVLASLVGLVVAAGTPLLIWDTASIRTGQPLQEYAFLPNGDYVLNITIPLYSQAYIFYVKDGNMTLAIYLENGTLIDVDSKEFYLSPGQSIELQFTLIIDNKTYTEIVNSNIDAYTEISISYWMGYQQFNLLKISLYTKSPLEVSG